MPSSEYALPTGTVLRGRYRIEEVLGAGAFGITYRATDTAVGKDRSVVAKELYHEEYRLDREGTAVSVPSAKKAKHQNLIERVLKQGILLRKLDHPHLMSVYEAFEAHNTAYLVVEHLEGASLRERLEEKVKLPEAEVWQLIEEVGAGLSALHEEEALHLDVKPANIVKASGKYVLIDYGAGRMGSVEDSVQLSTGGFTPEYAAYEQTDDSLEKGPYTDIYALGVTAYECLTGKLPPKSVARLMKEDGVLSWPDGIGSHLQLALGEALRVEPEARPKSVEAWLSEPETVEMPSGEPGYEEKVAAWQFAGAILLVAMGVIFFALWLGNGSRWEAQAYMLMGKPNWALEADSSYVPAWRSRGERLEGEGNLEAAFASYDRAVELDSSEAGLWKRRGEVAAELGRWEEVLGSYDRAVGLDSSNATTWARHGYALQQLGRLEQALDSYNRVLQIDSSYARVLEERGNVLQKQGRLNAALKSYDQALQADSLDAQTRKKRADVLWRQGRLDKALVSYDKALDDALGGVYSSDLSKKESFFREVFIPSEIRELIKVDKVEDLKEEIKRRVKEGVLFRGNEKGNFFRPDDCYIFIVNNSTGVVEEVVGPKRRGKRMGIISGKTYDKWKEVKRDKSTIWVEVVSR